MNRNKYLRILIAANKLYKVLGHIRIEQVDSPYYNIIIKKPQSGSSFRALVKGENFTETKEFDAYTNDINNHIAQIGITPIVLLAVNLNKETVRFGVVADCYNGRLELCNPVSMVLMNSVGITNFKNWISSIDASWNE